MIKKNMIYLSMYVYYVCMYIITHINKRHLNGYGI